MEKETHFDLCFVLCIVHWTLNIYVLCPLYFHHPKRKDRKGWILLYHQLRINRKVVWWNELDELKKRKWSKKSENILQMHKTKNEYANFRNCTPPNGQAFIFCPKKMIQSNELFLFLEYLATIFIVSHPTRIFSADDSFGKMFFSFVWKEINNDQTGTDVEVILASFQYCFVSINRGFHVNIFYLVLQGIWTLNELGHWIKYTVVVDSYRSISWSFQHSLRIIFKQNL